MENQQVTDKRQQKNLSYNRIESVMGVTGKITPQAVEFEEAVLGAFMMPAVSLSMDGWENFWGYRPKRTKRMSLLFGKKSS